LLVTTILLVLNISIFYISSFETTENFRKRLKSRASNNAQIFDFSGDSSLSILRRVDGGSLAMLPRKSVVIVDTTGRLLYHYRAENADSLILDSAQLREIMQEGEDFFYLGNRDAVGLYYTEGDRHFIISVTAVNEDGMQSLDQLKRLLIISLLIGMLVTLITGYVFSSQLVRPITSIIAEVNTISSHNLSKRLRTGISQDELNKLAETFNDLLDRLQDSFNTQRRFISNASHELSTPLTSISSQLQVTLQNERSAAEYQRILQSVQEDVEQMRQLTKGLLEIARTGSHGSIELNEFRIDELLMKVAADIRRNNPAFDVHLRFDDMPDAEEQVTVFGNFDLLYSAFRNIVENGCKFSPDKTSLVEMAFSGGEIVISVNNKGDIITEEEIEQIFQPFFRGTNASSAKGFGLGLPLARRIVTLHKGKIDVTSTQEGTRFSISIPSLTRSGE
jgi:two-component system, OmpR family, sensor histidine kinase ArlS